MVGRWGWEDGSGGGLGGGDRLLVGGGGTPIWKCPDVCVYIKIL